MVKRDLNFELYEKAYRIFFLNEATALQFYAFGMCDSLPMTFCQLLCALAKQQKAAFRERSTWQQSVPDLADHSN